MEDMTLIGVILIIIGIVLAIPTCFISLIILGLIGFILIIMGETGRKTYTNPYSAPYYQPYPQQPYPPRQYIAPTSSCPICGVPMRWVQQYNNWYCDYCRSYR
jgi:hypothetical protein